jgi:hypothetical protein
MAMPRMTTTIPRMRRTLNRIALMCMLAAQVHADLPWRASSTWKPDSAGPLFFATDGAWLLKGERPPGSANLDGKGAIHVSPPLDQSEASFFWIETQLPGAYASCYLGATIRITHIQRNRQTILISLKADDYLRTHLIATADRDTQKPRFAVAAMPGGRPNAFAQWPTDASEVRVVLHFQSGGPSRLWVLDPLDLERDDARSVASHNLSNHNRVSRFSLRLGPDATWSVSNVTVAETWEEAAGG